MWVVHNLPTLASGSFMPIPAMNVQSRNIIDSLTTVSNSFVSNFVHSLTIATTANRSGLGDCGVAGAVFVYVCVLALVPRSVSALVVAEEC